MKTTLITRLRKRSKSLNGLTKDQLEMLKQEYKIHLTIKNSEADALKLLRGGKFKFDIVVLMSSDQHKDDTTSKKLLKINKQGKHIYQYN